ncbi:MAG: phage terminase large subunit family protein [Kofleriaceae bacterium]
MTVVGRIERETAPEAIAAWRAARAHVAAIAFAPKSSLTLSEWADQFRFLSPDLGEPGPWRTSRVPYLRRIMDAITDPRVRRVSVMKSARIGATQGLVVNGIGYYIHQEPSPIIIGLPTVDDAQKFSATILQPAIDDTPVLAERVEKQRSKKRRQTMLQKAFPGGTAQIIGTVSPRAMRMVHGRIICKSEVDAWNGVAGSDGDPYLLIDRRADTYGNPKFIEESTPLIKATSRIEPAYLAGSQETYHVPCPHCREYQPLGWGGKDDHFGIKWGRRANGEPDLENVYYVCRPNGCEILETTKHGMVQAGDWAAAHPDRTEHLSFRLNALVSPFEGARWPRLVGEWTNAQRKPEQVRVFVNTVLGETYEEKGEQADQGTLEARRQEGWYDSDAPVPAGAARLIRSVDTQGDRLETAVWAWGAGEECWLIDYELIPGSPATTEPWEVLDALLEKSYRHPSGRDLLPSVTFVDSGGHHAKQVTAYTRARQHRRVYAIFGATEARAPILGRPKRNNSAKAILYPVGSFVGKEALLARLSKVTEPGPGYIHIPHWLEDEQLHQFAAEQLVTRGDKRVFVKTRARNEMTDLWVYALAGLHQLGAATVRSLGAIAAGMLPTPAAAAAPAPAAGVEVPPPPSMPRGPRPPRRGGGGWATGWK